ncbi:hypothetical protein B4U79_18813, partial [Dinothrombium tinctorium]
MMSRICLILLLQFFVVIASNKTNDDEGLKSLIILHRHGDRTPIGLYAKNVDRSFWYDGIGELTILLRPFEQKCRRVIDELNIVHSQYFLNITNEYEPLLNLLSEKTGVNFTNIWDILILYGILKPHYEMNHPLITNWSDKPDLDHLNEVGGRLLSYIFGTYHLQRLTA